jgi:hypothetical protein
MADNDVTRQIKERLVSEFPAELLSLALVYATNFQRLGYDITEKYDTATANRLLVQSARRVAYADFREHLYDGLDQERLKSTIEVLKQEKECVERNIKGCDRDCANCDLVLPDQKILDGYDFAIGLLSTMIK